MHPIKNTHRMRNGVDSIHNHMHSQWQAHNHMYSQWQAHNHMHSQWQLCRCVHNTVNVRLIRPVVCKQISLREHQKTIIWLLKSATDWLRKKNIHIWQASVHIISSEYSPPASICTPATHAPLYSLLKHEISITERGLLGYDWDIETSLAKDSWSSAMQSC